MIFLSVMPDRKRMRSVIGDFNPYFPEFVIPIAPWPYVSDLEEPGSVKNGRAACSK